jgi:hypothetical protein
MSRPTHRRDRPAEAAPPPGRSDLDAYAALGPPPAGALGRVAWASTVAAQLLYEVISDPLLDPAERRRSGRELVSVIASTHSRARVEEVIRELQTKAGILRRGQVPPMPGDRVIAISTDGPPPLRANSRIVRKPGDGQ